MACIVIETDAAEHAAEWSAYYRRARPGERAACRYLRMPAETIRTFLRVSTFPLPTIKGGTATRAEVERCLSIYESAIAELGE